MLFKVEGENYQSEPSTPDSYWLEKKTVSEVGYSAQPRLALDISHNHFSDRYYIWFSKDLNPPHGYSSRPIWIYKELSEAVRFGDRNHPKVQELVNGLLRGIAVRLQHDLQKQRELANQVVNADIRWFYPQLLKIKIGNEGVDKNQCRCNAIKNGATYNDEFLADNMINDQFVIIVE